MLVTPAVRASNRAAIVALTLPQAYAVSARCVRTSLTATALGNAAAGPSSRRRITTSAPLRRARAKTSSNSREPPKGSRSGFKGRPPGTLFAKKVFPDQQIAVPDYELPPPPSQGKVFRAAKAAIEGVRTDPYVLASFVRFGMAASSFKALLLAYASSDVLRPDMDPADVPRVLFDQWCQEQVSTLERVYLAKDQGSSASDEWQKTYAALTPIMLAARQHWQPDQESTVSMYRHFFQAFCRHFRSLIQESITKAEKALEQQHASALPAADIDDARAALRFTEHIFESTSLRRAHLANAGTRTLKRAIHLHVGPTNSGKTHGALLRLLAARTGVYLGPLRLLAHEVYDRISKGTISPEYGPRSCALLTGEEDHSTKMFLANGDYAYTGLCASTIEMTDTRSPCDVAIIDEIQMIGDPQRGSAWTEAFLGVRARELHLCGEPTTVPLIRKLAAECGDSLTIHEYERLTPLEVAEESLQGDLSKIRPGDCIVAFSRSAIFALKARIEEMEAQPGQPPLRCAVAYGNLPPEVRTEQAKIFNEGVHANVMVASDAIGMGLNLKIKRIIFESCTKYNGLESVALSASQIKQIAGRAGRFGTNTDGSADGGVVTCLQEDDMPILKAALASPKAYVNYATIAPNPTHATHLRGLLPEVVLPGVMEDYADSPFAFSKCKGLEDLEAMERNAADKQSQASGDLSVTNLKMYSSVYTDYVLLCDVNTSHYCLADFSQQRDLAPIINAASSTDMVDQHGVSVSSLTHRERELFTRAPVPTRDPLLIKAVQLMAREFCLDKGVEFKKILNELNISSSFDTVLKLMADMHWIWDQEKIKAKSNAKIRQTLGLPPLANEDGSAMDHDVSQEPSVIDLAQLLPARSALQHNFLMELERQHRFLIMYIWFSIRLPLVFMQGAEANQHSREVEKAIQFTLEGIRSGRAKRLQALGRDATTYREEKRARKRANKDKFRGRGGFSGDDDLRPSERAPRIQL